MKSSENLQHLDPAAFAIAEKRASQARMSVQEWVNRLILELGSVPMTPMEPWIARHLAAPEFYFWNSFHYPRRLRAKADSEEPSRPSSTVEGGINEVGEGLGSTSSALHLISVFHSRIDLAAVLLSTAFAEAAVTDFRRVAARRAPRRQSGSAGWYAELMHTCVVRSREVRNALVHRWEPTPRAERLAVDAFVLLSELTPAGNELLRLYQTDRRKAFSELAKHLDLITHEFELSAKLLAEVEATDDLSQDSEEQRFAELRESLLEKAGGGLSLTQAADLLGVSRQALHKRIKAGSALGMMHGAELVLPRVQFVEREGNFEFVSGLSEVLKLFGVAGGWSALQFLVDADPNLAETPIQALATGRIDDVVNAARAYLDANEA
jgi:hypothetical protein